MNERIIDLVLFPSLVLIIWVMIAILWQSFRRFFHKTYSFFDISFVIAYFAEQFLLVILSYFYPDWIRLWIGFFSLIVATTVTIQNLMWSSRNRRISEITNSIGNLSAKTVSMNNSLIKENKRLSEINDKLIDYIKNLEKER